MLIDWFTLVAQMVNFLVLVWLLKRFLWGKLIKAIDDRENGIETRLAEAAEKNRGAEKRIEEVNSRAADLVRERNEVLARTQREAEEVRLELTQRARDEVRGQEAKWREDLEREKAAFLDEVRRRMAAEILAVVRRALADLACADVQHCAVEMFLEKLQTADLSTVRDLATGHIAVLSAAELLPETRARIESVLGARVGKPVPVEFDCRPAMSWGIELRSNGQRIGWTPETYLESLDDNLQKALQARPKALVG